MQKTQDIRIEDYHYPLPEERIAKFPLPQRDSSRLLLWSGGELSQTVFRRLPEVLPADSLLVFNNTRVIQARLHFHKETGAAVEIFCLEPFAPRDYAQAFQAKGGCTWLCMVGNSKKWKEGALHRDFEWDGQTVRLSAVRKEARGSAFEIAFSWDDERLSFGEILERSGELPIPPYLNRATQESDKETYQTVYSKISGSVAAPTAGLHFTPEVLAGLEAAGIPRLELTLHVGAGTFKPVKSETIEGHEMHTEFISVDLSLIEQLAATDRRVIAVGTTSVRTLESLYYIGRTLEYAPDTAPEELQVQQWQPYDRSVAEIAPRRALENIAASLRRRGLSRLVTSTRIIIAPGYRFKIVQGIVTNFHQPQSTLLLLVSAFVEGRWREIYDYALLHGFRFLSYGDSSLLLPGKRKNGESGQ